MSDNRRTAFRCVTPDEFLAIVRRGKKDVECQLVDQSAGGFAIVGRLRAKVGQKFQLRTYRGWSEVEVTRAERDGKDSKLGLKVLRELPDPRDRTRTSLSLFSNKVSGGYATQVVPLMTIAITAVLGFWVYMAFTAYRFSQ